MTALQVQPRKPAGTPVGGQFGERSGSAPDVTLDADGGSEQPSETHRPCSACSTPTQRSSGLCKRCDPTSKKNRRSGTGDHPAGDKQDLAAVIEQGVAELVSGDDWKRWLDVQSKFRNYSFGNTMLILMQRPSATRVAGFRKWQEMGRQVNAGERGISILAPVVKQVVDDETGEVIGQRTFFRGVAVFDISQTDGEPLPSPVSRLEGDAPAGMIDDLSAHATALGASASFVDPSDDSAFAGSSTCNGYASRNADGSLRIVVRNDISPAQQAKTFAHEIGHVALGHLDEVSSTAGHLSRADQELEAESFAYLVSASWGVDSGDYSFGYTASWSGGDPKRVREVAERVSKRVKPFLAAGG